MINVQKYVIIKISKICKKIAENRLGYLEKGRDSMGIIIGVLIAIATAFICLLGIGVLVYWASGILILGAIVGIIAGFITGNEKCRNAYIKVLVIMIIARIISSYLNNIASQIWR